MSFICQTENLQGSLSLFKRLTYMLGQNLSVVFVLRRLNWYRCIIRYFCI